MKSHLKKVIKGYHPINMKRPPHQYEEVQKHLKEMIEIGAIWRLKSPWTSAVELVRKKDSCLRFCVDLKLHARTVKDACSLPCVEECLDCLNGAQIFTSLDLKSGYWQTEFQKSIPLTTFTVGPMGYYECICMPFGLWRYLQIFNGWWSLVWGICIWIGASLT